MKQNSNYLVVLIISFLAHYSCSVYGKGAEAGEQLFQEGYVLYQQYSGARALEKFKAAAELGHVEAAYYAGEMLRQDFTFINDESEQYYRQAAEGGEVYAMLRLGTTDKLCGILRDCDYDPEMWVSKALSHALPKAEAGDSEAMMALFSIYWRKGERGEALEWTIKAAEHGNAFAQYWLAVGLLSERKMGFYWTDSARREDIIRWLRESAKQRFPKAMLRLALKLRKKGEYEEAQYWVEEMGKTDYYSAVLESGSAVMLGPDVVSIYGDDSDYGFAKPRPVEGAALLLALHRQTGEDTPLEVIEDYRDKITPEMMQEAKALSKNLLVDTPILHYLPKFGI